MSPTFSTFVQLLGFAIGTYLLGRYRLWRANRRDIPMELQNGVWVPDAKLKRWERRAKLSFAAGLVIMFVLAYFLLTSISASVPTH